MLRDLDRLTVRGKVTGKADAMWKDKSYPCHGEHLKEFCHPGDCDGDCDYARLLERLAAYEDTGLTPDEVASLKAKSKTPTKA